MRQRSLAVSTSRRKDTSFGRVESQYLVGSSSPSGHSISSHSSGRASVRLYSRCAIRTRTRAKREDSHSAVPSRHLIVRHARLRSPRASCLTEIGRCLPSRRISFGGRPWPDHLFGGNGTVPVGQTVVFGRVPAT